MTSKIWGEKPKSETAHYDDSGPEERYNAYDMDDWLENLKLEYDILKTAVRVYEDIKDPVVIAKDKLEKLKERLDLLESIEGTELVGLFDIDGAGLQLIDKYKVEVLEEKAEKWEALKGFFHECCPSCGSINVDWKKAYCKDCLEQFLQIRGDWLDDYVRRVHGEELYKAKRWDDLMEKSMEAPYIDCVENLEKLNVIKDKFKLYDQPPMGMSRTLIIKQIRKILEP